MPPRTERRYVRPAMMKFLTDLMSIPLYRAVAILVGTVVAAFVVERIVNRGLMRLAENTETELDDEIIALVLPENAGSIRVLDKLGMLAAGTEMCEGLEALLYVAKKS